jgi:hypothetical protein
VPVAQGIGAYFLLIAESNLDNMHRCQMNKIKKKETDFVILKCMESSGIGYEH